MATKTEIQSLEFATVNVGDRVWLSSSYAHSERSGGLKRVVNTSPAFIYLEGNKEFNTYKRDGHQYGRHLRGRITGIATEEECDAWDAERAKEAAVRQARELASSLAKEKRKELRGLFTAEEEDRNIGGFSVCGAQWGTTEERTGLYDVTFHGLTEEQVRELAHKQRG